MNYSVKKTLSSCKGKIANHPSSDTFFNYQFLSNLQKSGCVGKDTGWDPKYFVHQNDSVILYHSGNEKFKTTNTGAVVTGILTATTSSVVGTDGAFYNWCCFISSLDSSE